MGNIILENKNTKNMTMISNHFIDQIMPDTNGEFVKIYLYLLRCSQNPGDISICKIADVFHHTENDVSRALLYWENAGLLTLGFNEGGELNRLTINSFPESISSEQTAVTTTYNQHENHAVTSSSYIQPEQQATTSNAYIQPEQQTTTSNAYIQPEQQTAATTYEEAISYTEETQSSEKYTTPPKKQYSANEVAQFSKDDEICELLFVIEKVMGKTLSSTDTNTVLYLLDQLKFSSELIEYLIEYCVENGHKSLRYAEKVAIAWHEKGIQTVEEAKLDSPIYIKRCYPILKAFGISNRHPGENEKNYILKWTDTYGFDMDIILEACNRTMNAIHQPSFKYADSILSDWKNKGVTHVNHIQELDAQFQKEKEHKAKEAENKRNNNSNAKANTSTSNAFHNFSQRDYDYDELEKQLLKAH